MISYIITADCLFLQEFGHFIWLSNFNPILSRRFENDISGFASNIQSLLNKHFLKLIINLISTKALKFPQTNFNNAL